MPAPTPPGAAPEESQPPVGHPSMSRWARFWPVAALAALGFTMRLVPVLRGGGLQGMDTHDPYVYYASAVALFSGRAPYRDFLFLHPPGILLAVQPFAALGSLLGDANGMALARIAFMLVGTANVLLIYRLLRPVGTAAAVIGAGLYAVWAPATYVERTVRLEGLATLLVLLCLLLVARLEDTRRPLLVAAAAGLLVGLGATVKLWGAVPAVIVVVWLLWKYGWKTAGAAAAAGLAAVVAVMAPFALAAPNWFDSLVVEQLGRGRSGVGIGGRVLGIVGMGGTQPPWSYLLLGIGGSLTVIALVVALRTAEGQLPALLVIASTVVLLAGPSWYRHYPAFLAGPLCLVYGSTTAVAAARLSPRGRRAAATAIGVLIGISAVVQLSHSPGRVLPLDELRGVLDQRSGCVTSDRPSTTLVLTDQLRTNLARGCPVVLDLVGYRVTRSSNDPSGLPPGELHTAFVTDYLASAPTTVTVLPLTTFTPAQRARIESWPLLADLGRVKVREPD